MNMSVQEGYEVKLVFFYENLASRDKVQSSQAAIQDPIYNTFPSL